MIEQGKLILDRFKLNKKIGCAIFSRQFVLKKRYEAFSQQIIQFLNDDKQWIIYQTNYQQIQPLFKNMEICLISRLCFEDFEIPRPIKDISKVKFINLTQLHLIKNQIVSIQALGLMHFPKLLILDISRNIIGNLSPLKKMKFPMLSGLYISGNKILSLQALATCSLPNLDIIQLQWQIDDLTDNFCQRLAKFDSINIRVDVKAIEEYLKITCYIYKMFKKRFSKIQFKRSNEKIIYNY